MSVNVPILLGSSRPGRKSLHVANYLLKQMQTYETVQTRLLDLAEYNLPILGETPANVEQFSEKLTDFTNAILNADGLVIVAPEYKRGYPAVLKNALDYLPFNVFARKPVAVSTVTAGPGGGADCLAQLRLVCIGMGGCPIPGTLPIPNVGEWFDDENGTPLNPALDERAKTFLDEIIWYAEAIAARREVAIEG